MTMMILLVLLGLFSVVAAGTGCSFPAPAANFQYKGYEGKWYEIGKIQTKGGAFFEKDCVCTELNVSIQDYTSGDGLADNDCRYARKYYFVLSSRLPDFV